VSWEICDGVCVSYVDAFQIYLLGLEFWRLIWVVGGHAIPVSIKSKVNVDVPRQVYVIRRSGIASLGASP
jgi:hypothetical protein